LKKLGSASDPLWYKDAIIYEIHVRAFADSNNDGIGDFQGLIGKLDYLQDLGVTCLWLLPFMPSPLRDDGYDIADYTDVNPSYGTLDDFKQFLDAAHKRNIQVMIELVINHTSDQHPWFKAARLAPPGSPERDMYVWSDTDQKYQGVRIIFTDTEKSNWTWDDTAKAFYWHRFFSHQPDLNFDHPRVMQEVIAAMRFWLDMGVDALRLDAIPYLIERDGTSCENVPETHVKIKEIRAVIDAEYSNRLILAEANMWPADVRPYFGDADECHMAFHFPLMPRIYMALRQEDRLPITDIMAQTPEIPPECQWGLFLRNHDELTLEMVTDDERDYMNLAYASDPRMRINVGIRRRLAPLVDNNRGRIELLNSLLLSFPGTPIMYYGDEIGMGDNIYLGDRNGVRTPMQWNSDRNAGFSRCDPARLYFPVVMDPVYGYQVVNVEAQLSDQSSLLHWSRNMIALRKLFQVFGRGTLRFLHPENRKILAYIRDLAREDGTHETVLCVANLSRFAQPVDLDLKDFAGAQPVEMLGYVSFPPITAQPYVLSVAPYSFLWFELQPAAAGSAPTPEASTNLEAAEVDEETSQIALALQTEGWSALTLGPGLALLQSRLPAWLARQRWFGAKTRPIQQIRIANFVTLPSRSAQPKQQATALFFVEITYSQGEPDTYQFPLALSSGGDLETITASAPNSIIATLFTSGGPVVLHDAAVREDFRQALLTLIEEHSTLPANRPGDEAQTLEGSTTSAFPEARGTGILPSRISSAEQSNSNVLYDQRMILKLFRRLEPGQNPDVEIGRFLTEVANFPRIAPFLGQINLNKARVPDSLLSGEAKGPILRQGISESSATSDSTTPNSTTTAMLQQLIPNQGDGWQWTLDDLSRFYESVAGCPPPPSSRPATLLTDGQIPKEADEKAGLYLAAAALLGRRTAELHLALATPTDDPAFAAEPFTPKDLSLDANRIDTQIHRTLDALRAGMATLGTDGVQALTADDAATLLSRRIELFARAHAITKQTGTEPETSGKRIRIHGDYHLGQVLRAHGDFVLLDFEGEPARTLAERRRKQSPLKDVAGMLRSFSYAAYTGLDQYVQRHPDALRALDPWARLWQNAVCTAFLNAYKQTIAADPSLLPEATQAQALLDAYLLEKALYELLYELNNRPTWVRIPLTGILSILT
jgi:maltose alpha-D-glucosyltransferase/alpha-amylase